MYYTGCGKSRKVRIDPLKLNKERRVHKWLLMINNKREIVATTGITEILHWVPLLIKKAIMLIQQIAESIVVHQ